MLNSLRKNPVTKESFSNTYKTLAKIWSKNPIHGSIFQGAFVIDFVKKEPTFILSNNIIQILKLVLHMTEYKKIIWMISNQGETICKKALLELDLTHQFKLLYWLNPVEALGMNFKEGIFIIDNNKWPLIINKLKIKLFRTHSKNNNYRY